MEKELLEFGLLVDNGCVNAAEFRGAEAVHNHEEQRLGCPLL